MDFEHVLDLECKNIPLQPKHQVRLLAHLLLIPRFGTASLLARLAFLSLNPDSS
jgi:hypothetical protein